MPSLTSRSEHPQSTISTGTSSRDTHSTHSTFSPPAPSPPATLSPRKQGGPFLPSFENPRPDPEPFSVETQRSHLIPADPSRVERAFDVMHDARAVRGDVVRAEIGDVAEI